MHQQFKVSEFKNGLTLVGLEMPEVQSTAANLILRAGSIYDQANQVGSAAILSEWIMRGSANLTSRQINEKFDQLGCHHHQSVSSLHMQFSTVQLNQNLSEVLKLIADIFRVPNFADETFEACKQLIVQDQICMEDEPSRKCSTLIREKFFPYPLGRSKLGNAETIANISAESLRQQAAKLLRPQGAILAIAGNFDFDQTAKQIDQLLGDWTGDEIDIPAYSVQDSTYTHIEKETAQTHISLAHKSVSPVNDMYYSARVAEAILSRGMGSRLFTEVRQKRGLCYGISSQYASINKYAGMITYAGTRPELAQQTLDVTIDQLGLLADGITSKELERAKTQIRSMMIMQGQSTSARASALVSDWYLLGRLRSLEELSDAICAVTEQDVLNYVNKFPAENFSLVTVGPKKLTLK